MYTCSRNLSKAFSFKPILQTAYWVIPHECPIEVSKLPSATLNSLSYLANWLLLLPFSVWTNGIRDPNLGLSLDSSFSHHLYLNQSPHSPDPMVCITFTVPAAVTSVHAITPIPQITATPTWLVLPSLFLLPTSRPTLYPAARVNFQTRVITCSKAFKNLPLSLE